MKEESFGLGVSENDIPLVEFGAVVVKFLISGDEGPDVVAVAAGVVGEKGEGVHSFPGEVVEGSDEAFSFAVFPSGISVFPVL